MVNIIHLGTCTTCRNLEITTESHPWGATSARETLAECQEYETVKYIMDLEPVKVVGTSCQCPKWKPNLGWCVFHKVWFLADGPCPDCERDHYKEMARSEAEAMGGGP